MILSLIGAFSGAATPLAPIPGRVLLASTPPYFGEFPDVMAGDLLAFGVDFTALLGTNETIVSASSVVSTIYGVDPDPADLAASSPAITGNMVSQSLGPAWITNDLYAWEVTVTTDEGQTIVGWARIFVKPIS